MSVTCTSIVELSPEEVDRVFWKRLNDISEHMFMREGFLWRICGRGDKNEELEERIAPIEDGPYNVAIQALRLKKAILKAAI